MGFNITEQQYRTTAQSIQSRYIRLELLNFEYQTVEELSGLCISGSLTIDANSDVRRSGNVQLIVKDSTFEVEPGGKIWLDKYIRVWVGIDSIRTGEVEYTNCGMYLIDAPSYNFDPATNTLTLSLLDLMAKLTGMRNGYIQGAPVLLKSGENIRQAIIKTLELAGFNKYVVEEAPTPGIIPNNLEFDIGVTYYEVLSGLRDIYPNYEIFFDVNGTFFYKEIPTGKDEPVFIKDDTWDNIVLSENLSTDFQNIKNIIEVFGRTHDPEHLAVKDNTSVSGNEITLTLAGVDSYSEDMIYGFEVVDGNTLTEPTLRINSLSYYPMLNDKEAKVNIIGEKDSNIYCVQYVTKYQLSVSGKEPMTVVGLSNFLNAVNQKYGKEYKDTSEITEGSVSQLSHHWYYLGHLQAHGYVEDKNPESPFNIDGPTGKIYLPLYDGVFSNCITDELAQQRAEFELYQHTNMNNKISLRCVPVYWFDVNILVEYTLKRNNYKNQYLIKNVNFGLAPSDSMTVSMIQYYPESPNIINI